MTVPHAMESPRGIRARLGHWPGVLLVAMSVSACDQELIPLLPTEMAFSIYGHLDVTADTQWIRIAPLRSTILSTPDPVDAVVTVEDLGTGRTIEMIPTRFTQRSGNFDDTLYAYNFRTTELIDHEATYRLTARRSDGTGSAAFVKIPVDHSHLPMVIGSPRRGMPFATPYYIRFRVLPWAYVAMVQTRIVTGTPPGVPSELVCPTYSDYQYLPPSPPIDVGGEIQVDLRLPGWIHPITPPPGCMVLKREVRVILSGEAWPFDPFADNSHFNAVDNIENGVGFLGGVQILVLPWPGQCPLGPGDADFCERLYFPNAPNDPLL